MIQHWFNEMEISSSSADAFIAGDREFHRSIFNASHNEFLESTAAAIGTALRAGRTITTRLQGSWIAALPLHKAVADAIAHHDRVAARSSSPSSSPKPHAIFTGRISCRGQIGFEGTYIYI